MFRSIRPTAAALVLALLATATAFGGAGALRGAFTVDAHSTNVHTIWFDGGSPARILVVGDGDTDLDVRVYDRFGELVAADLDELDTCLVEWFPVRGGTYRIEVRNLGGVYNEYAITTN